MGIAILTFLVDDNIIRQRAEFDALYELLLNTISILIFMYGNDELSVYPDRDDLEAFQVLYGL